MINDSLEQAAEKSQQAEIICRMLEVYPDRLADTEVIAIATLLRRLTGDVSTWLIDKQYEHKSTT